MAKSTKPPRCKTCRVPFERHAGVQETCKRLETAVTALRVIGTWATFDNGKFLSPEDVEDLVDKALNEIDWRKEQP